ncbi:hypothetical protein N499_0277B, partial [Wolbachia pipientis wVitA]|jgi:ubiquitin C
LLS